jgi:hypothetical protein
VWDGTKAFFLFWCFRVLILDMTESPIHEAMIHCLLTPLIPLFLFSGSFNASSSHGQTAVLLQIEAVSANASVS